MSDPTTTPTPPTATTEETGISSIAASLVPNDEFAKLVDQGMYTFGDLQFIFTPADEESESAPIMIAFHVADDAKTPFENAKLAQHVVPWSVLRQVLSVMCLSIDDNGKPTREAKEIAQARKLAAPVDKSKLN
ncbi:MAG: hypothetical protein ACRD34_00010 [Bryobacteraceae bacterium]